MQGQQDGKMEPINNHQNIWASEYDRDFSKLLDSSILQQLEDLPRATSAPPHFYERAGSASADTTGRNSRLPPVDSYTDIRFDEEYVAYYEMNAGKRNLPPPIENNTIYSEISSLFAQQQFKDVNSIPNMNYPITIGHQPNFMNHHHHSFNAFDSQSSLNRSGGLETVQEVTSTQGQNVHESVIQALNQLNMNTNNNNNRIPNITTSSASAITTNTSNPVTTMSLGGTTTAIAAEQSLDRLPSPQRPGSQPAPNPYEAAIAAGAGHFRSASALPTFNLENIPTLNTSSPTASSQAAVMEGMYASQQQQQQQQQQNPTDFMMGNSLDYQVAYQAAYQAALIQSQNNTQMMLGQPPQALGGGGGGSGGGSGNNGIGVGVGPNVAAKIPGMPGHGLTIETTGLGSTIQKSNIVNGNSSNHHQQVLGAQIHSPLHNFTIPTANAAKTNLNHNLITKPVAVAQSEMNTTTTPTYDKDERNNRNKRYGRRNEREKEREYTENYYDSQYYKYNNLEEVVGQVIQVAQDQNGCRFLQKKFDEGGSQAISIVFPEIKDNIVSLMMDPFGNYLIQKLLDKCSEEQRTQVVKTVAEKGELVSIALSTHGTRAVQKLIETLTTEEQKQLAISALKPGVVSLIKDLNGNHVVQRCLHRLGPEDSQFIYNAAIYHCVEIASHRHGCCVLQRCIDFATPDQKSAMIEEIAKNALVLSQDAFGNYVVQYVLDLGVPDAGQAIMVRLLGHYAELSTQKFSSNVVEKCLKMSGLDETRERIIREVMLSPLLPRLLQDAYGNYVVQSALTVTSGALHQSLVDCIRPYLPTLRGTPHGKRILQKVMASLKDPFNPN